MAAEEERDMAEAFNRREASLKYVWQICTEECCSDQVFQLTANIFDRVLLMPDAADYRSDLLVSSVLGLATYTRRTKPITPSALKEYLNGYFTTQDIIDCQMWITDMLSDQIEAPVPSDYNRILVNNLNSIEDKKNEVLHCANKFVNLAIPDRHFFQWSAERIGRAGVMAAIRRLPNAEHVWPIEKRRIQRISELCMDILEQDMEKFENFIAICISDAKLISSAWSCISSQTNISSSPLTNLQLNNGPVFPTYSEH